MRSNTISYFFLALATVLAILALVMLLNHKPPQPQKEALLKTYNEPEVKVAVDENSFQPALKNIIEDSLDGLSTANPSDLLNQLSAALNENNLKKSSSLIGKQALTEEKNKLLETLINRLPKNHKSVIREIGELELNKRSRWAIELFPTAEEKATIYLDLSNTNGKWTIKEITILDSSSAEKDGLIVHDSLSICDMFIQAIINKNLVLARSFVNYEYITDAKLAGLCILFEEGNYLLRPTKPLRAMFIRDNLCGYLANVISSDKSSSAQFAINLRKHKPESNWQVTEINLDGLLSDYAKRMAGGDIYYSPLIINPTGGDTLAIYFEFDENTMNTRTMRQLQIIADILISDKSKNITISGHTDSKGANVYNDQLSYQRALAVKDFLLSAQVTPEQIITNAKGSSQPRRPNITESGADDPQGRRANRRSEIYLDF